ncbi:MAG TPA: hypothetical protein VI749_03390 [Candidatus Omnitrophota bacterium]|nr:hypothetical protein [Candidatus Omnitrophota bacterium]
MKIDTLVLQPFGEMLNLVLPFIPTLATALGILIIGFVVATLVKRFTFETLRVVKFDTFSDKLGFDKILHTGGIKHGPCMLLSLFIYAVLMVMVLIMTVKSLGIAVGNEMVTKLMAFIPSVLTGILVLIIGMLIAKVVSGLVFVVASNTEMPSPELLSKITKISILAYVTIIFLKEIGFVGLFTGIHYTIFMTGVVFALALAFGLAGRTIAGKYLEALKR